MAMVTIETIQETLTRVEAMMVNLQSQLQISGTQVVVVEGLSDISQSLGLVKAGEFRSGFGTPGLGFTGVRMGSPGWLYDGVRYALVGISNDTIQFGLSNEDGRIYAGAGAVWLDQDGIGFLDIGTGSTASDLSVFTFYHQDASNNLHQIGGLYGDVGGATGAVHLFGIHAADDPWTATSARISVIDDAITPAIINLSTSGSITVDAITLVAVNAPTIELNASGELNLNPGLLKITGEPYSDLTDEFDAMGFWMPDFTRGFVTGDRGQMVGAAFSHPYWTAAAASAITTRSATVFIDGAPTLTNYTASRNYALDVVGGMWLETGGLNLGTGISAGDGSMSYSGNLLAWRNSTNYTGYIYVPLTTPLGAPADWDGNDTKTVGTWSIDTSAVFGVPAGAKALLVRMGGTWAAAAAGSYAALRSKGGIYNQGVLISGGAAPNEYFGIVNCDANGDIDVVVAGASMLNAFMFIFGYWL